MFGSADKNLKKMEQNNWFVDHLLIWPNFTLFTAALNPPTSNPPKGLFIFIPTFPGDVV